MSAPDLMPCPICGCQPIPVSAEDPSASVACGSQFFVDRVVDAVPCPMSATSWAAWNYFARKSYVTHMAAYSDRLKAATQ